MPPILAALLCTGFILWLLARDIKRNPNVSKALWIPISWMVIIGSRLPSEWVMGRVVVMDNPNQYLEGSSLDRSVFLLLILMGSIVLARRSVNWRKVLVNNAAITAFFALSLVSIAWSDFPFVAAKRWYKVFGHIVMALIVLTDPNPRRAFTALFWRNACILIPLSVLFIKYFPEFGRYFDYWTGEAFNAGVTTNKNSLGVFCLVMIPMLLSMLLASKSKTSSSVWIDKWINVALLVMAAWLLHLARSSASLVSTIVACTIVLGLHASWFRRSFTSFFVTSVALFTILLCILLI